LAIIVNKATHASYSGAFVLHDILIKAGLSDAKVVKIGAHYAVEVGGWIIDSHPIWNINIPPEKKFGAKEVLVIRRDVDTEYSEYYRDKKEYDVEPVKEYQRQSHIEFLQKSGKDMKKLSEDEV
ncbi:unnamed protein product, partial [marine sediment metagenome]